MGVQSTLRITRTRAIKLLIEKLHGDINDKTLESFMDFMLEDCMHNAVIVPDGEDNDDDDLLHLHLKTDGN